MRTRRYTIYGFSAIAVVFAAAIFLTPSSRQEILVNRMMLALALVGVLVATLDYLHRIGVSTNDEGKEREEQAHREIVQNLHSRSKLARRPERSSIGLLRIGSAVSFGAAASYFFLFAVLSKSIWPFDWTLIACWLVPAALAAIGSAELAYAPDSVAIDQGQRDKSLKQFEAVFILSISLLGLASWAFAISTI